MSKITKSEAKQANNFYAFMSEKMTAEEYQVALPKPRKPSRHLEADAQMALIEWCNAQGYPYNRLYAIENERKTLTPQQAGRRKRMGVRSGVSDLALDVARGGYHGLKIEMKSASGRVSESQQTFIDEVRAEGYAAHICYSTEQAIEVLKNYCKESKPCQTN